MHFKDPWIIKDLKHKALFSVISMWTPSSVRFCKQTVASAQFATNLHVILEGSERLTFMVKTDSFRSSWRFEGNCYK